MDEEIIVSYFFRAGGYLFPKSGRVWEINSDEKRVQSVYG